MTVSSRSPREREPLLAVQFELLSQFYQSSPSTIDAWVAINQQLIDFHLLRCDAIFEDIMSIMDRVLAKRVVSDSESSDDVAPLHIEPRRADSDSPWARDVGADELGPLYEQLVETFGIALFLIEQCDHTDRRRSLTRESMLDRFRDEDSESCECFVRWLWHPWEENASEQRQVAILRRTELVVHYIKSCLFGSSEVLIVDEIPDSLARKRRAAEVLAAQYAKYRELETHRFRGNSYRQSLPPQGPDHDGASGEDDIPF